MTRVWPDPSLLLTFMGSDCKMQRFFLNLRAKVTINHVLHARKKRFWWPFVTFRDLTLTLLSVTPLLTGYLYQPFEVTLAQFRAKAIDSAGPRLYHEETSRFDLWPDPNFKVKLKILNIIWGDLMENCWTTPRGARYDYWFSGGSRTAQQSSDTPEGSDPTTPPPGGRGYGNSPGGVGL